MLSNLVQWRSLKSRVLVFTLGIFLVSLWSLSFYASRMLQGDLQIMLSQQQFSNVTQLATLIDHELEDRLQSLEIIAASFSPAVLQNTALLQTTLNKQVIALRLFNGGIFVTDAQGTAIADAPQAAGRIGSNYMDRSAIALPLKDGNAMIGKPAWGKKLLAPIFSISTPIRDQQGKVTGVLVGTVNLGLPNFLTPILNRPYGKTGGYLLVAPQHQLIVSATDESRTMQPTPATGLNPMLDQYMQGVEGYGASLDAAGIAELTAAKGIPAAGWFLAVKFPLTEAFAPIHAMQLRMLFATLLLTFLTGVLTWWVLKRQLAPMQRAAKTIAMQSHTDQPLQPLPVQHRDEIGDLIQGFNCLLAIVGLRESALFESEQRFRMLIEHNNAVILQIDPASGQILDANDSASVFYGWTRAQLCDMNIQDFHTLNPNQVADQLKEAAHGKGYCFVSMHRLANGESRSVEVHFTSIASGPKTVLIAIIHNVTERERANEKLRVSDLALKAVSQGVLISGADGLIVSVNDAFMAITGFDEAEIMGHTCLFVQGPLTDPETVAAIRSARNTLTNFAGEVLNYRKDGSMFWNDLTISPLLDAQGKLTHFIGVTRDITARKLIEDEKKRLNQRLRDQQFYTRSLIESNIDAIITTDPAGIITDVNRQMELLTDCTRDELIGAPFKKHFTDPERAEAAIKLVMGERTVTNYELTARTRNGLKTVVSFNASTFYDRDRTLQGVFAAARDVTERKRLDWVLQEKNIELETARLMADKANFAKSDFLSSMSHELRSPLNAILGFAQLMDSETPPPTKRQQENIAQILRAGWHLLKLINEILDLTKIESRQIPLSKEPVALAAVLSECQSMFELQARQRAITLRFPPADLAYFVMADQTRLKQVFINLLTNAIKYNTLQGTVEVTCKPGAVGRIRVSIRDTGMGLNPAQLSQLFQPFNRLGQEASSVEGTGIGLVVAKQLVELMGGTIGAESQAGEGSEFWFELLEVAAPAASLDASS